MSRREGKDDVLPGVAAELPRGIVQLSSGQNVCGVITSIREGFACVLPDLDQYGDWLPEREGIVCFPARLVDAVTLPVTREEAAAYRERAR